MILVYSPKYPTATQESKRNLYFIEPTARGRTSRVTRARDFSNGRSRHNFYNTAQRQRSRFLLSRNFLLFVFLDFYCSKARKCTVLQLIRHSAHTARRGGLAPARARGLAGAASACTIRITAPCMSASECTLRLNLARSPPDGMRSPPRSRRAPCRPRLLRAAAGAPGGVGPGLQLGLRLGLEQGLGYGYGYGGDWG